MVEMVVQLIIIGVWSAMIGSHTRRLLRLAQAISFTSLHERPLRRRLDRVWWWLGREEFWRNVQADSVRCVQLTLMILLLAWGVSVWVY